MKKINMSLLNVKLVGQDGVEVEVRYALKESMVEMLFHPLLKLNSFNLLRNEELAKKIINSGNELLIEDEEYERMKSALETIEGLRKNDLGMVHRILDAETVQVETKTS